MWPGTRRVAIIAPPRGARRHLFQPDCEGAPGARQARMRLGRPGKRAVQQGKSNMARVKRHVLKLGIAHPGVNRGVRFGGGSSPLCHACETFGIYVPPASTAY